MIEGKRICVVVHYEGMSGAVRSLRHRLGGLARDASVEFLVPGPGPAERELSAMGTVHELDFSALTFPSSAVGAPGRLIDLKRQVRRFSDHFQRFRPDLVVLTSMMVPAAGMAARRQGIPALVHASELLNAERLPSPAKRAVARGLLKGTARWATTVIACSDLVAEQFSQADIRVETIYPPIATDGEPGDGGSFRRRHGIREKEPCVAMVGNITRGRGQDLLLRAMPLVRVRLPGVRCLIVGDPFDRERDLDYRQRLTNLCRELEIEDAVSFTGLVDGMADVYAACDVVANPARIPESFGRVACEALVAGRPVVATRVGAVPEVLDHRRTALLVEPDVPQELAGALIELIEDRQLAAEMVAAGREEVSRRFAPAAAAARFGELAEEALTGERAERPTIPPPAPSAQARHSAEAQL
jgi:glycosyltransferase involved in cell wall biosynthesis